MKPLIEIVEYNPDWAEEYLKEKEILVAAIGEYISSIHHIGSTSVFGLKAKPIIDIIIEIYNYPPEEHIIKSLENLEYVNMGEAGFEERYWFKKGDPRKYHVHIVRDNSKIAEKLLLFRNVLRENDIKAREYEKLKIKEATGKALDNNDYAISKNTFVDSIIKKR